MPETKGDEIENRLFKLYVQERMRELSLAASDIERITARNPDIKKISTATVERILNPNHRKGFQRGTRRAVMIALDGSSGAFDKFKAEHKDDLPAPDQARFSEKSDTREGIEQQNTSSFSSETPIVEEIDQQDHKDKKAKPKEYSEKDNFSENRDPNSKNENEEHANADKQKEKYIDPLNPKTEPIEAPYKLLRSSLLNGTYLFSIFVAIAVLFLIALSTNIFMSEKSTSENHDKAISDYNAALQPLYEKWNDHVHTFSSTNKYAIDITELSKSVSIESVCANHNDSAVTGNMRYKRFSLGNPGSLNGQDYYSEYFYVYKTHTGEYTINYSTIGEVTFSRESIVCDEETITHARNIISVTRDSLAQLIEKRDLIAKEIRDIRKRFYPDN